MNNTAIDSNNGQFKCDRHNTSLLIGSGGFADIFQGQYQNITKNDNSEQYHTSESIWIPVAIKYINQAHLNQSDTVTTVEHNNYSNDDDNDDDTSSVHQKIESKNISTRSSLPPSLPPSSISTEHEFLHEIRMMQLVQGNCSILQLFDVYLPTSSASVQSITSNNNQSNLLSLDPLKQIKRSVHTQSASTSVRTSLPLDLSQCCMIVEKASCNLNDILYSSSVLPIQTLLSTLSTNYIPSVISTAAAAATATTTAATTTAITIKQQILHSLKIKLCWFIQCFEGLDHMYTKGVIHHDIKPDNIFYFPPPSLATATATTATATATTATTTTTTATATATATATTATTATTTATTTTATATTATTATATATAITDTHSSTFFNTMRLSQLDSTALAAVIGQMKIADFGLSHIHQPHSLCSAVKPQLVVWYKKKEQQAKLDESKNKLRRSRESQAEQRRKQHQIDKQSKLLSTTSINKSKNQDVSAVAVQSTKSGIKIMDKKNKINNDSDTSNSNSNNSGSDSDQDPISTALAKTNKSTNTTTTTNSISKSKLPSSIKSITNTSSTINSHCISCGHNKVNNVTPEVICKGQPVYHAPELLYYPPKCTPASDVYALTVVFNEALTCLKPIEEHSVHINSTIRHNNHDLNDGIIKKDHKATTATTASATQVPSTNTSTTVSNTGVATSVGKETVLHVAGSLPVQVCSGIRPHLFDGNLSFISPTCTGDLSPNPNPNPNIQSVSTQSLSLQMPYTLVLPIEITKRIQHAIKTGWASKASDRPLAKGMMTSLRKILEMVEVYELSLIV